MIRQHDVDRLSQLAAVAHLRYRQAAQDIVLEQGGPTQIPNVVWAHCGSEVEFLGMCCEHTLIDMMRDQLRPRDPDFVVFTGDSLYRVWEPGESRPEELEPGFLESEREAGDMAVRDGVQTIGVMRDPGVVILCMSMYHYGDHGELVWDEEMTRRIWHAGAGVGPDRWVVASLRAAWR